MAQFIPTHIHAALDILATEREQTTAERDAFVAFHDRIEALDASPARSAGGLAQQWDTPLGLKSPPKTHLQRARDAYRETVMSVPHYADEYDESLAKNLAAEFAPAVARAMTTSDAFTPPLRERLLVESQQAHADRAALLSVLEQEVDAVRRARETLTTAADFELLTARSLDSWSGEALADARERVVDAEQRCNELACERQTTLHTDRMPGPRHTEMSLHGYLYQSLSVTHPVLADVAELADLLQTARRRIDRTRDIQDRDPQDRDTSGRDGRTENAHRVDSRLL